MPRNEPGSGRFRLELLVFLAVLLLVFIRMKGVVPMVRAALDSRGQYETQETFLQHEDNVGGDIVLIGWLKEHYPNGTPVSVPDEIREPLRMQRLWYGLLPDFPLDPESPLVFVHKASVKPGEQVLANGELFALVERQPSVPAP